MSDSAIRQRLADLEPPRPPARSGGLRGIVTGAGDAGTLLNAYLMLHRVRFLGCELPAVVFHTSDEVVPDSVKAVFPSDTTFQRLPDDVPSGCHLKPFALYLAPFDRVLWLDADTLLFRDPTALFDHPDPAVFWPDVYRYTDVDLLEVFGVGARTLELESGQMLVQPDSVARGLWATCLLNRDHRPAIESRVLGDKDTFRLGFSATGQAWTTIQHLPALVGDYGWEVPIESLGQTMKIRGDAGEPSEIGLLQHAPDGAPLLLHRTVREWRAWDYVQGIRWHAPTAVQGEPGEVQPPSDELLDLEAWALARIPEVEFFHEAFADPAVRRFWLKHRFAVEAAIARAFTVAHRWRNRSS